MKERTLLEEACMEILGEEFVDYYEPLSNLLLLNPDYIENDDSRLSAKITAILFDPGLKDKPHLICNFIENPDINAEFKESEIQDVKKILTVDPELVNTIKIVELMKQNVITPDFEDKLQLLVKNDMEKLAFADRARFIQKY